MITKLILTDSYRFDDLPVSLVPLHRRGVDDGFIRKVAGTNGVFHKELSEMKPIDGHTVFHILAVGDSEAYGGNRNCDEFSGSDNVSNHHYFKTAGHVFTHHRNQSPHLKTGQVLATAHNDQMSRIELLIALENAKHAEAIEDASKGKDIPFSMGSQQAYDVCKWCGHKAPTAKEHCEHIKEHLGEVREDGVPCNMENPDPHYFDISRVHKPADRIAYSLRKVAGASDIVGGHELAEAYGVIAPGSTKHAMLVRLAEMEKRIQAMGKPVGGPKQLHRETSCELKKMAALHGMDHLLSYLHQNAILLSFPDFCDIVVGQSKLARSSDEPDLTDGFNRLLADQTEVTSLDGSTRHTGIGFSMTESSLNDLTKSASLAPRPVQDRVLAASIMRPEPKTAQAIDSVEQRGLEEFYLHYKLAFACHDQNAQSEQVLQNLVLTNILRA
jgi:hypothetical protein